MAPGFREDRVIPGLFIAFFVALACLEAGLIAVSVRCFTGLSESDPYRRGLTYNRTLEARARDLALGLRVDISYAPTGPLSGDVAIAVRDNGDAPLASPVITAAAHRITDKPKVVPIVLHPERSAFVRGSLSASEPGRWFIKVRISVGHQVAERIREILVEGP